MPRAATGSPIARPGASPAFPSTTSPASRSRDIVGPEAAKRYLSRNREVLETGNPASDVTRLTVDGGVRVVQTDHIPVSPSQELPRGVLVVENDITETVTERERRARILGQIVRTLVGIVDRRDPMPPTIPSASPCWRARSLAR